MKLETKNVQAKYKEDSDMDYAKMIDHTLLKPEASETQIKKLCEEAREYGKHKAIKGNVVFLLQHVFDGKYDVVDEIK